MTAPVDAWLAARTHPTPDGCADWTGAVDRDGYGQLTAYGKAWRAHRYAWYLAHGPIPAGLIVRHTCDRPSCCQPSHLKLGTPADNRADRVSRQRDLRLRDARWAAAGQQTLTV